MTRLSFVLRKREDASLFVLRVIAMVLMKCAPHEREATLRWAWDKHLQLKREEKRSAPREYLK